LIDGQWPPLWPARNPANAIRRYSSTGTSSSEPGEPGEPEM
jgi:hypothetical protein